MYKCLDCGDFFEEPDTRDIVNPSEYWGRPVNEYLQAEVCPHCGSEDIEEAKECIICGSPSEDDFCKDCHIDLENQLEELKHRYEITYDILQDFIAEHFGW